MADWDPDLVDIDITYTDILANIRARDVDAATLLAGGGSNLPENAKRWNSDIHLLQNWNGASWDNLVVSVAGGGTGATTPQAAREALGAHNAGNLSTGTLPAGRFNDTAHGNRGGGALHAEATTSASGFMPAADKLRFDSLQPHPSPTSTTAGRYLIPGSAGLLTLAGSAAPEIADFAANLRPSLYRANLGTVTGGPPGASGWATVLAEDSDGGPTFTVKQSTGTASALRMWYGSRSGTTGAVFWVELFHSGGVPAVHIGQPFPLWDHIDGVEPPSNSGYMRFVRLTAGDSYNSGLLISESVTGAAPLVEAYAEIAVGPLQGEVVPLINTMQAFIRARAVSGELQFDQMQRITGAFPGGRATVGYPLDGAFSSLPNYQLRLAGNNPALYVGFDSGNSPNARVSSTTSGETAPKSVSANYYMRIQ